MREDLTAAREETQKFNELINNLDPEILKAVKQGGAPPTPLETAANVLTHTTNASAAAANVLNLMITTPVNTTPVNSTPVNSTNSSQVSSQDDGNDGSNDGNNDGNKDGSNDGNNDGSSDGNNDGSSDGNNDGSSDGRKDGNNQHEINQVVRNQYHPFGNIAAPFPFKCSVPQDVQRELDELREEQKSAKENAIKSLKTNVALNSKVKTLEAQLRKKTDKDEQLQRIRKLTEALKRCERREVELKNETSMKKKETAEQIGHLRDELRTSKHQLAEQMQNVYRLQKKIKMSAQQFRSLDDIRGKRMTSSGMIGDVRVQNLLSGTFSDVGEITEASAFVDAEKTVEAQQLASDTYILVHGVTFRNNVSCPLSFEDMQDMQMFINQRDGSLY